MTKFRITAKQKANLEEALYVMWPSVPEENVSKDLIYFRENEDFYTQVSCNTIACFGGWCVWWPSFKTAFGLDRSGPYRWFHIQIFGEDVSYLFNPRDVHPADATFTGSDHACVTNRLKWTLERVEVV